MSGRDRIRHGFASIVVVVFSVVSIGAALPPSRSSDLVTPVVDPVRRATGFNQNWSLFSPNPLSTEVETSALVDLADGTQVRWRPVAGIKPIDSIRQQRWRKWESRVRLNVNERFWPAAAAYVVDRFASDANPVVRVRLIREWSKVPPPDVRSNDRELSSYHFYEWDVASATGRVLDSEDQPTE